MISSHGYVSRRCYERAHIAAYAGPYGRSARFSGKSTLALALSRTLHWPVLDKDTLKSPLLLAGISEDVAAGTAYELLFAVARDILVEQHISVILDSPARFPIILERATELAQAAGARLKVVRCRADSALRNHRLATRPRRPSQLTLDQATEQDERLWYAHLPADTIMVHTSNLLPDVVATVVAFIQDPNGGTAQMQ